MNQWYIVVLVGAVVGVLLGYTAAWGVKKKLFFPYTPEVLGVGSALVGISPGFVFWFPTSKHEIGFFFLYLLVFICAFAVALFVFIFWGGGGRWKRWRKKTSAKLQALLQKVREQAPGLSPQPNPA